MYTDELKRRFYKLKAQQELATNRLNMLSSEIRKVRKSIITIKKAKWVLSEAERITQTYFKDRVESLVTTVISSVFDPTLKFKLDFIHKSNRLQCVSSVTDGTENFNLEFDEAGGLLDLVSFGFRIALWSMYKSKSRRTFILDEPMRFVDQDESIEKTSKILKDISRELKLQLIIITHDRQLSEIGDRVFTVTKEGAISTVSTEGRTIVKTKKRRIKRTGSKTTPKI